MNDSDTNKPKFCIGQPVMYRRYGICTVVATERQQFGETEKLYYSLEPMFGKKSKFFVPADMAELDNVMRNLLAKQDLLDAIKSAHKRDATWEDDGRVRSAQFDELLKNGDIEDMIWLIRVLTLHREYMREVGRTFLDMDKRVLAFAERLVTDEFSYVLGIDKTEVIDFIRAHAESLA